VALEAMSAGSTAAARTSAGSNFYYAFRVLPREKRRAIYALYSFCRVVDDCVDEEGGEGEAGLQRWMEEVRRCYAGRPETPLGQELAAALHRFPIPRGCFEDIVAGCRMDLTASRYATWPDLRLYCERVASAVGLASIEIFEYDDPRTRGYAVELGLALQLTNILRDLSADAARGRLYVPLEDLARYGVGEEELRAALAVPGPAPERLRPLLDHQAARARDHYARAEALLPAADRRAMVPARIMSAVYRVLLDQVVGRGYPFGVRVRVSRARKAWIALTTLWSRPG
jgi:15-cis-phytoene synthase